MSKLFDLGKIFKSNSVSSTNPKKDLARITNKDTSEVSTSPDDMLGTYQMYNLDQILNAVRDNQYNRDGLYDEYRTMTEEVIISATLKSYSDDATVIDNTRNKSLWLDSDDETLVRELEAFLSSIKVYDKVWGWIYQVSQYGDKYVKNIYNSRGYLVGIEDVHDPKLVYDVVENGEHQGFIIKQDPRLHKYQEGGRYPDIDIYGPGAYTHMYLDDDPNVDTIIVDSQDDSGKMNALQFEVLRGNSAIESVRTTYRIVRLLEDTIITNKIARAEYYRVFNVEVGEQNGKQSNSTIKRFKRFFDSRPRFDGTTGEYSSTRNYRPSADAIFNATHKGVGAVSISDVGGNIETHYLTDLDYFKNKLFSGLNIPKSFLGFEESVTSGLSDGGGTLAKLDIRYSRTVRRIQNSVVRSIQFLCDMYLASRDRYDDIGKVTVSMLNPSSAEELARLDELLKRIEIIANIVKSVADISDDTVNLPHLYARLVDEFIDIPAVRTLFEELLSTSITIKHIEINTKLLSDRGESLDSYKELTSKIDEIADPTKSSSSVSDDSESSLDDSDDSSSGSLSGFDDLSDMSDDSSVTDLTEDNPEPDIPLGGLDDKMNVDDDTSSSSSSNELLDSYKPKVSRKLIESYRDTANCTQLMDDMINLAVHGPKQFRKSAELISSKLATIGFNESTITECYELIYKINKFESSKGLDSKKLRKVTDSLTSNDFAEVLSKMMK